MAIYVECSKCHRKQSLENDMCVKCDLDLRTLRRKNKLAYWVYLRYRGRQVWERIGQSLTISREQEAIIRAKLVKDEYNPPEKTANNRLNPFFNNLYLPWAQKNKRSWTKDLSMFRDHISEYFGDIKLSKITTQMVKEFTERRINSGAKNATVNRDLALLKTIFNKASKWEVYSGINPVRNAGMLPEANEHVARALTQPEAFLLLDELPTETRPIFEFALATAIRIGNILNLQWDQIDSSHRIIRLPVTKSGKALNIPLNDWAFDILKKHPRHVRSKYVFCKGTGLPYRNPTNGFKRALKRAGLDKSIRIHDLRHTAATWLAANGVPTAVLKDLLGHTTLAMVSRYSHVGQSTLLEMSNRISRPLEIQANQYANKAK